MSAPLSALKQLTLVLVEPQPEYIEASGRWKWPLKVPYDNDGRCPHVYTASREWWEYAPSGAKPHPFAEGVRLRDDVWYWAVPAHSGVDSQPTANSSNPMTHALNCPGSRWDGDCTCGLAWRELLETERSLKGAWEKRAMEAEAELRGLRSGGETSAERSAATAAAIIRTFERALVKIDTYTPSSTVQPVQIAREALREAYGPNYRSAVKAAVPPETTCSTCAKHEKDMEQELEERDRNADYADQLTAMIGVYFETDHGEHSNLNEPWENAIETMRVAIGTKQAPEDREAIAEGDARYYSPEKTSAPIDDTPAQQLAQGIRAGKVGDQDDPHSDLPVELNP